MRLLTSYLIKKKKQLRREPTLMELYEETHIKKGDKKKNKKIFIDTRAEVFVCKSFNSYHNFNNVCFHQ